MNIEVVWGNGEGRTALSAFDSALADGGIHNYNLVTLSSVIPAGAKVVEKGQHEREWGVGEMVGVVLSENESTVSGETIASGLGWATAEEGGVFFEASSQSAKNVEELVTRGVKTAKEKRSTWDWDEGIETRVTEHTVEENGATIVSAIYKPV
jgi:arginine decarboxylase